MNKGFFLLWRDLWEKQWFLDMDHEQQMTVINIVRLTNWRANKLRNGTILQPGQLAISERKFADKIKTTRQRLRTVLTICSNVEFSTHESTQGFTIITIVNWATYQAYSKCANPDNNPQPTQDQPTANPDLTKKQITKELYMPEFERLWKKYPRKEGKTNAVKSFRKLAQKTGETELLEVAIENYTAKCIRERTESTYIMHGSTFFNEVWRDFLEVPEPFALPPKTNKLAI